MDSLYALCAKVEDDRTLAWVHCRVQAGLNSMAVADHGVPYAQDGGLVGLDRAAEMQRTFVFERVYNS